MITEKQRAANRANAKNSTGPRTEAGKAISRGNARRHGLATAVRLEPGADAEIEELARKITEDAARADLIDLARRIAEAEIDLRRIRRVRVVHEKIPLPPLNSKLAASPNLKLFTANMKHANRCKNASIEHSTALLAKASRKPDTPHLIAVLVEQRKRDPRVKALDRYERRAISRRKSAIRAFDAARREP